MEFQLDEQAVAWIRERAASRGIHESQAAAELIELGYAVHRHGGLIERFQELDIQVIGGVFDKGWCDLQPSTGL